MIWIILTLNIISVIGIKMRTLCLRMYFLRSVLLIVVSFFLLCPLPIDQFQIFGTWKLFPRKIAKKIQRYCKCYINVRNLIYSRTISILTKISHQKLRFHGRSNMKPRCIKLAIYRSLMKINYTCGSYSMNFETTYFYHR